MTAPDAVLVEGHCVDCGAWRLRWSTGYWRACWRCGDPWPPQPTPSTPTAELMEDTQWLATTSPR